MQVKIETKMKKLHEVEH